MMTKITVHWYRWVTTWSPHVGSMGILDGDLTLMLFPSSCSRIIITAQKSEELEPFEWCRHKIPIIVHGQNLVVTCWTYEKSRWVCYSDVIPEFLFKNYHKSSKIERVGASWNILTMNVNLGTWPKLGHHMFDLWTNLVFQLLWWYSWTPVQ